MANVEVNARRSMPTLNWHVPPRTVVTQHAFDTFFYGLLENIFRVSFHRFIIVSRAISSFGSSSTSFTVTVMVPGKSFGIRCIKS